MTVTKLKLNLFFFLEIIFFSVIFSSSIQAQFISSYMTSKELSIDKSNYGITRFHYENGQLLLDTYTGGAVTSNLGMLAVGSSEDSYVLGFSYQDYNGQNDIPDFYVKTYYEGLEDEDNYLAFGSLATGDILTISGENKVAINTSNYLEALTVGGTMTTDGAYRAYLYDSNAALGFGAITDKHSGVTYDGISFIALTLSGDDYVPSNNNSSSQALQGYGLFSAGTKTFIIDHPLDPDRYLIHAALEGPTTDVFYRGVIDLKQGKATIVLPSYVKDLIIADSESILLQNMTGFDTVYVSDFDLDSNTIAIMSEQSTSDASVSWELKAVRKNAAFDTEPLKANLKVMGHGPYTYGIEQ